MLLAYHPPTYPPTQQLLVICDVTLPLAWQRELSPVVLVPRPALLHHGVSEHLLDDADDGVVVGVDTLHVSSAGSPLEKTNDWEELQRGRALTYQNITSHHGNRVSLGAIQLSLLAGDLLLLLLLLLLLGFLTGRLSSGLWDHVHYLKQQSLP